MSNKTKKRFLQKKNCASRKCFVSRRKYRHKNKITRKIKRGGGGEDWKRYKEGRAKYESRTPEQRVTEYIRLLDTHKDTIITSSGQEEDYLLDVIVKEGDLEKVTPETTAKYNALIEGNATSFNAKMKEVSDDRKARDDAEYKFNEKQRQQEVFKASSANNGVNVLARSRNVVREPLSAAPKVKKPEPEQAPQETEEEKEARVAKEKKDREGEAEWKKYEEGKKPFLQMSPFKRIEKCLALLNKHSENPSDIKSDEEKYLLYLIKEKNDYGELSDDEKTTLFGVYNVDTQTYANKKDHSNFVSSMIYAGSNLSDIQASHNAYSYLKVKEETQPQLETETFSQNYVFTPLDNNLNASIIAKIDKNEEIVSEQISADDGLSEADIRKIDSYERKTDPTPEQTADYEANKEKIRSIKEKISALETEMKELQNQLKPYIEKPKNISVGAIVNANRNNEGKFFTGKISAVNDDKTFDVDYDDGKTEKNLNINMIKPNTLTVHEQAEEAEIIKKIDEISEKIQANANISDTVRPIANKILSYEKEHIKSPEETVQYERLKSIQNLGESESPLEKQVFSKEEKKYIQKLKSSVTLYPRNEKCPYSLEELYIIYQLVNSIATSKMTDIRATLSSEDDLIKGIVNDADADALASIYLKDNLGSIFGEVNAKDQGFLPRNQSTSGKASLGNKHVEIKNMAYLTEQSQYVDRPIS
jgi:hypothetical protein